MSIAASSKPPDVTIPVFADLFPLGLSIATLILLLFLSVLQFIRFIYLTTFEFKVSRGLVPRQCLYRKGTYGNRDLWYSERLLALYVYHLRRFLNGGLMILHYYRIQRILDFALGRHSFALRFDSCWWVTILF